MPGFKAEHCRRDEVAGRRCPTNPDLRRPWIPLFHGNLRSLLGEGIHA